MRSICFVVTTPFTANAFLVEHLLRLSRLYAVTLCLNRDHYPVSSELKNSSINIVNIPLERKFSPWKDLRALFLLARVFYQSHFYSVHSLTSKAGLLAMCAAYLVQVPNRIHTFTGQVWENKRGIKRLLLIRFDWLIAKLATQVFADSFSQARFLIDQKVCADGFISVLGSGSVSGVNLIRFTPNENIRIDLRSELGIPNEFCLFLFVGRLCRDKGIWDLLDAFFKLKATFPDIVLLVVGPDEEEIFVKASAIYGKKISQIFWLGQTFKPESFMASADILMLPSYREGFGSVIIEAAACGIPAIAYRTNGVIDAIKDGVTGLLCTKGVVADLHRNMERLARSPDLRKALGKSAFIQAREKFSSELIVDAWINFYEKLSEGPSIYRTFIKRILDLLLSSIALLVLMIPMALIGFAVRITSKGPALYWSKRVGKKNQIFSMPKFRSMHVEAPTLATHLLERPDSWLTPIGAFLRRSSMDELPQLFSVWSGKMSLVGPRPALDGQEDLVRLRTNFHIEQLRPGLTGWAQINGRDELSNEKKVAYDVEYLSRCSILFDIRILFITVLKVIQGEGVSH